MTTYAYKLIEYDAQKPWVIRSTGRDSVELPEDQSFDAWAAAQYPSDRYRVELERESFRWAARD